MNITHVNEGKKITVGIEGRLDTATAPELEKFFEGALAGTEELVIDCENLEYISSAGLRVILKTQKTMNVQGEMKLIHVNEMIMEVFDITGFSDILKIE